MGIKQLYRYLAPVIKSGNISEFSGKTICVDAMIYLFVYALLFSDEDKY
jgi:hypothetical protein